MEMMIVEHEMLSAMLCKMKGIEMGQGDLAAVPEELTGDELRVLRYASDWEVQGVNEKLALVAAWLRETPAAERCRCAYEMIMNGCDRTTRTIFAKNAGYISVENYETVLRELAEQEARAEQKLLSDYAKRYGHFTDEFFYQLGCCAVESAGYISAERGERQREEAKSRIFYISDPIDIK